MATREELYAVLGELAVTFANLEHNVLRVLDLLTRGDAFLGPILLDDLSISRVLGYIRKYIKARLREVPKLHDRTKKLMHEVNQVRMDRNLFIHGQWFIDDATLASGRVSCLEYKLRYDEELKLWLYLHDRKFTVNGLRNKLLQISKIRDDAIQLADDIQVYFAPRK